MILNIRDENTGKIIPVDTNNLTGTIGIKDSDTGKIYIINLASLPTSIKVIDANTGKIITVDGTTPFTVVDADTGKIKQVNPASPSGTLSVVDDNTGKIVTVNLSEEFVTKTDGLDYIKSASVPYSFPSTPILDNFNRTDGGPPPSASWGSFDASWGVLDELSVVSNQAYALISTGFNYWKDGSFGPNCEVYCTITDVPAFAAQTMLFLRLVGENTDRLTTGSFYQLIIDTNWDGIHEVIYNIIRVDGLNTTLLADGSDTFTLLAGDSIGLSRVGNVITAHYKQSGGSWTIIASVTDPSPLSAVPGRIAVSTSTYIDNFGGGTIT